MDPQRKMGTCPLTSPNAPYARLRLTRLADTWDVATHLNLQEKRSRKSVDPIRSTHLYTYMRICSMWRNVYKNLFIIITITYKSWQKGVYQLVQECAGFQWATGYGKAMQGFCIVWWLGLGFSSYHISLAKCDTCPSTLKSAGLAWTCLTTSKLGHIVLVHEKNAEIHWVQ